jgi:hypothetical protein
MHIRASAAFVHSIIMASYLMMRKQEAFCWGMFTWCEVDEVRLERGNGAGGGVELVEDAGGRDGKERRQEMRQDVQRLQSQPHHLLHTHITGGSKLISIGPRSQSIKKESKIGSHRFRDPSYCRSP